jgi:tetratricopeptide (TPR) repeat protein
LRIEPAAADARNALAEGHFELGNALLQARRYADAMGEYQQSLQFRPDNAEARTDLGNLYLASRRPTQAILEYEEALRLRPDDDRMRQNLDRAQRALSGNSP